MGFGNRLLTSSRGLGFGDRLLTSWRGLGFGDRLLTSLRGLGFGDRLLTSSRGLGFDNRLLMRVSIMGLRYISAVCMQRYVAPPHFHFGIRARLLEHLLWKNFMPDTQYKHL